MSGLRTEVIKLSNGKPGRRVVEDWACDGATIPKGFKFDGASSPRMFWRIVPPFRNLEASCKHDWDCEKARKMRDAGLDKEALAKRKQADEDYGKRIADCDGWLIGKIAYIGVRIGSITGAGWNNVC